MYKYFTFRGKRYYHDAEIYVRQVDTETLILERPYNFNGTIIPTDFEWNGASSPNTPLTRWIAPKFYKNIRASCVHDFKCKFARNAKERREADNTYWLMKVYVEEDDSLICDLSWLGVRIGAALGIGSNF